MNKDVIDIYYDHYKETYSISKEAQAHRNKCYILLCVLEALLFLLLINPDFIVHVINKGVRSQFNIALNIGTGIIQTLLWIIIAYVFVRYCQDMMYVEKQYPYLEKLEQRISEELSEDIFSREGIHYSTDYPIVSNLIDLFYKMVSPILFQVINVYYIISEWNTIETTTFKLLIDTLIFGSIFIINWFYFFQIHSKMSDWFKTHIPVIDKISRFLHKIMKEV